MAKRSKKSAKKSTAPDDHPEGWKYADEPRPVRPSRGGKRSSPPGKRRLALMTTPERYREILAIIEHWPLNRPLDWKVLMDLIGARYHGKWTRQALAKYDDLQDAFTKRLGQVEEAMAKAKPKDGKKPRKARTRDEQVEYLKRQLDAANKEIVDLKVQYAILDNRMARWRKNALGRGMTVAQLDKKLQENDRGRSDKS
ncbi:hypothetical protein IQ17_05082 [Bradyrhizobium daqingense]|uniref:Uncharacterized protein n=2 Tax=Bradyrhizobium daqingense TaxID=993502 RepID=A0A562KWL8_9BRAD|nr:hypothetical protein IQ17_05082 [Bradyrhizobium daqingense]